MSMNTYSNRQLDSSIKSSDSENAHSSWNFQMEWKTTEKGNPRWIQWKTQRIWTFWWNLWEKWNKIKLTVQNRFRNRRLRWNCCIPLRTSPKRYIYNALYVWLFVCINSYIYTTTGGFVSPRSTYECQSGWDVFGRACAMCVCVGAILYECDIVSIERWAQ